MLLSLVYLFVRRLLGLLIPGDQIGRTREVELLVLRHEVKVLRRQVRTPAYRRRDGVLLAACSRLLPRASWRAFLVTPQCPRSRTAHLWLCELEEPYVSRSDPFQGRSLVSPERGNGTETETSGPVAPIPSRKAGLLGADELAPIQGEQRRGRRHGRGSGPEGPYLVAGGAGLEPEPVQHPGSDERPRKGLQLETDEEILPFGPVGEVHAGRAFDLEFLADLPEGADPCGENGEFHTFVWHAPMYREPIGCRTGEVVARDGFVYCDVLPT